MKVEKVEKRQIQSFSELNVGDVFFLYNTEEADWYFLKLNEFIVNFEDSFDLKNNGFYSVKDTDSVIKVNAKVVIE